MGTVIRPEVSKSNEYWIPRDRYYELEHFCLQYPSWIEFCREADSMSKIRLDKILPKKIYVIAIRCCMQLNFVSEILVISISLKLQRMRQIFSLQNIY